MMQDIRGNPINTGDIVYLVTINKDLSFTPIALRAVQSILHSPGMISLETKDGQRRVHHQSQISLDYKYIVEATIQHFTDLHQAIPGMLNNLADIADKPPTL